MWDMWLVTWVLGFELWSSCLSRKCLLLTTEPAEGTVLEIVQAPWPCALSHARLPPAQLLLSSCGGAEESSLISQFLYSVLTIASFYIPEASGPLGERLN